MKIKNFKQNIFLFGVIFTLSFLTMMITGNLGRTFSGPISFKETIEKAPEILVFSIVLLILGKIGERGINKSEEKAIEAARKRIEEREKTEQLEKKDTVERQNNDQIKEN